MDTPDPDVGATRIVLEVNSVAHPIHGRLRPEVGEAESFSGWLELTRALERLINEAARRAAPPEGHPGP